MNGFTPATNHHQLHLGYLTRGHPIRFFTRLAQEGEALRRSLHAKYIAEGHKDKVEEVEGPLDAPKSPFEDEL